MSAPKFTPGPWKSCCNGACNTGLIWALPADVVVAQALSCHDRDTLGDGVSQEVAAANARLIAAAPELLAALVRLKRDGCNCAVNEPHQGGCDACGQARAVIARATGGEP